MRRTSLAMLAVFLALAVAALLAPSPPNNANLNGKTAISSVANLNMAQADVGQQVAISNNSEYAVVEVAMANMGARANFSLSSNLYTGGTEWYLDRVSSFAAGNGNMTPSGDKANPGMDGAHRARSAPLTTNKSSVELKLNAASVNIRA